MQLQSSFAPVRETRRVERYEAIVIGAGQAGLAVGHHLATRGVDFAILTGESRIGDNWRRRWDSLRLFTPASRSGLPGMPFPAPPAHLPDKDAVANYLEQYADHFDLPVRTASPVQSLTHDGDRFAMRVGATALSADNVVGAASLDAGKVVGAAALEADNVVVATGAFQQPRVPPLAARLSPDIRQIHSSEYRNPFVLPDGPVLVVGAGNSGAQIALELARYRKVWLAGRNTGHLPRRLLGRDVFDFIWPVAVRATVASRLGRRLRASTRAGGDALIGIPEQSLVDAGVRRVGRAEGERAGLPVCGGEVLDPAVIVWCTGFQPDYSWIDLPVFGEDGYPRHMGGIVGEAPGLYFAGLRFQHRLTSSLIGGVGADAERIAGAVAARCDAVLSS